MTAHDKIETSRFWTFEASSPFASKLADRDGLSWIDNGAVADVELALNSPTATMGIIDDWSHLSAGGP